MKVIDRKAVLTGLKHYNKGEIGILELTKFLIALPYLEVPEEYTDNETFKKIIKQGIKVLEAAGEI